MEYLNQYIQNLIINLLLKYDSLDQEESKLKPKNSICKSNQIDSCVLDDLCSIENQHTIDGLPCLDDRYDDMDSFQSYNKTMISLGLVSWRWFNAVSKSNSHLRAKLVGDRDMSFPGPVVDGERLWSLPVPISSLDSKFSLSQAKYIATLTLLLDSTCNRLLTSNEVAKLSINSNLPVKLRQMIPSIRRKKAIDILDYASHNIYSKFRSTNQSVSRLSHVNLIFKRCYSQLGGKIMSLMSNFNVHVTIVQDLHQLSLENIQVDSPSEEMVEFQPLNLQSTTICSNFTSRDDESIYYRYLESIRPDNLVLSFSNNVTDVSRHARYQPLFCVDSLKHILIQSDFVELADLVVGLHTSNIKSLNCNILYHQIIQDCKLTDNRAPIYNNFFQLHSESDPYHQTENTCQWTSTTPIYHYTNIRQHIQSFCDSLANNHSLENLTLKNYCSSFSHKKACFCHDHDNNSIPSKLKMPLSPLLNDGLARAILVNTALTSITLSGLTGIVNDSFFKALESNIHISSLVLTDGTLSDNNTIASLVNMLVVNKTIKYINIANNPQLDTSKPLARIMATNHSLDEIDLSFNNFKDLQTLVQQLNHYKSDINTKSLKITINNSKSIESNLSKLSSKHLNLNYIFNCNQPIDQQENHFNKEICRYTFS